MSGPVFRLGLVGAGRMGRTHLRALAGSASVAVTAVVEPVEAARTAIAERGLPTFTDLAQLLDTKGVDGVLIAAPSDLHASLVVQVAEAGLPVLCEKPCGLSSVEIREIEQAVERHGIPLQVAYWRRYVPPLQALRRRMEAGELGEVHLLASYQWDRQPPASSFRARSGGIFRDMGVHEFDQVRWLSGQEFGEIAAISVPFSEEIGAWKDVDSAQAMATLSGGGTAFVSLGRYFPGGDMARVEVFGSRNAVRCDFLDPSEGERAQLNALVRQAEGFAAFARGAPQTGASVDDAAAALDVAERAWAALQPLRAPVAGTAA